MKNYRGLVVGIGILSGAVFGYYHRQDFPPGTRYIQGHFFRTENNLTKTATGVTGGAVAGFFEGIILALLLKHYISRPKKSN